MPYVRNGEDYDIPPEENLLTYRNREVELLAMKYLQNISTAFFFFCKCHTPYGRRRSLHTHPCCAFYSVRLY